MNLISDHTAWVFLTGSDEARFLQDTVFGIRTLLNRGVSVSQIATFVQTSKQVDYFANFRETELWEDTWVYDHAISFKSYVEGIKAANLVLVINGHGYFTGEVAIDPPLTPNSVLTSIWKNPHLKFGLVLLGTCYAGSFNFVDARRKNEQGVIHPELVIAGGTDLTPSGSTHVEIESLEREFCQGISCVGSLPPWSANLFLLGFFYALLTEKDIDGDGSCTVMDLFKFAGTFTNHYLTESKFPSAFRLHTVFRKFELERGVIKRLLNKLRKKSDEEQRLLADAALKESKWLYWSQNPFILNSNLARKIKI